MSASWSWVALAYVLGVATLPAVVFASWAWERVGGSGWTTHELACRHYGGSPSGMTPAGRRLAPSGWALSWRCPETHETASVTRLDGDDPGACRGLWVRGWVARLVPNRVLWPQAVRLAARRERAAAEHERVAAVAEARSGTTAAVESLRRLARETREGLHDGW